MKSQLISSVLPAALFLLAYAYRDSLEGVWWRVAGLLQNDFGKAATSHLEPRELRWLSRFGLALTQLTGTASEINEMLEDLLDRPEVRQVRDGTPGARRHPMRMVFLRWYWHLIFGKPAGLVLVGLIAIGASYVAASVSCFSAPNPVVAAGQLGPIPVLITVLMAVTGTRDGSITTAEGARQGMLRLATLAIGGFAIVTLLSRSGWQEGSTAAPVVGGTGLVLSIVGTWSPQRWWIEPGRRSRVLAAGLVGGALLANLATVIEVATAQPSFTFGMALVNLLAAASLTMTALVVAAAVRLPDLAAASIPLD